MTAAEPSAPDLIAPRRLGELAFEPPVWALRTYDPVRNRRFEGAYGRIYNRVIQSRWLRRAAFSIWGSADPLYDLEGFVADAVAAARAGTEATVLVDLPSGGSTLLPFLAREDFPGTVVQVDLGTAMLRRAAGLHASSTPGLDAVFVQSDALDLCLDDRVADVVVSVNGLHVVADHARFLAELARITRPGGTLWLITPVDGPGLRSRLILAAARSSGSLRASPRPGTVCTPCSRRRGSGSSGRTAAQASPAWPATVPRTTAPGQAADGASRPPPYALCLGSLGTGRESLSLIVRRPRRAASTSAEATTRAQSWSR